MIYKNTINLEGKTIDEIEFILIRSYQHPDILYILPKNCTCLFYDSIDFKYIGNWNTSRVTNMHCMFSSSRFNGDISNFDTSNVIDMFAMFSYSKFNSDISNWNISNVENINYVFYQSIFNMDVSRWNIFEDLKIFNIF